MTQATIWKRVAGTGIAWLAALVWGIAASAPAQTWINVTPYPLPNGVTSPGSIVTGSDGALWFSAGYVGRITTGGMVTLYSVEDCCGFYLGQITPGPDGALWFTMGKAVFGSGAGPIGRITTSGVPTAYELPTGSDPAGGITAGPDGALWFTLGSSSIGRITTAGVITEYPLPAGNVASMIAAGPDGALWFTEPENNQIGRITTAGAVTEYALPTAGSGPWAITPGPDGALWFTEQGANQIGRITTAGAITEYPVLTANSSLFGIVAGPDGALWFTEEFGGPQRDGAIGRITTDGVVTEYPAGGRSSSITVGPDRALWFTDNTGNKIDRAPACGLGLRASFADGTLTMNFNLGIARPATWYAQARTSAGDKQLWSRPVHATVPPDAFTLTWGPGFPDEGMMTIVSGLQAAPHQGFCYETATVNTAGAGPAGR